MRKTNGLSDEVIRKHRHDKRAKHDAMQKQQKQDQKHEKRMNEDQELGVD